VRGIIPVTWRKYTVPVGCTVIQWVTDFSNRVKQLQKVSSLVSSAGAKELQSFPVWLGGLLNPEAYITATRQCVAQTNSWPLEELLLDVTITEAGSDGCDQKDSCFGVVGLKLQGAHCKNNQLLLTSTILTELPLTLLRWVRIGSPDHQKGKLTLPVYLNSTRAEMMFTIDLAVAPGQDQHSFYERGVAVLTSTALN
jgi:dynein heavy chain 1, cytosolic